MNFVFIDKESYYFTSVDQVIIDKWDIKNPQLQSLMDKNSNVFNDNEKNSIYDGNGMCLSSDRNKICRLIAHTNTISNTER